MSLFGNHRSSHQAIEDACTAYRERLPEPDPGWPPDVRALVGAIHAHLFDPDVRIRDIRDQNGLYNNDVSGAFRFHVGLPPRDYMLHHRIELAKHLLATTDLLVGDVARGGGWGSPGAFSTTFKRHVSETPSLYRQRMQD